MKHKELKVGAAVILALIAAVAGLYWRGRWEMENGFPMWEQAVKFPVRSSTYIKFCEIRQVSGDGLAWDELLLSSAELEFVNELVVVDYA